MNSEYVVINGFFQSSSAPPGTATTAVAAAAIAAIAAVVTVVVIAIVAVAVGIRSLLRWSVLLVLFLRPGLIPAVSVEVREASLHRLEGRSSLPLVAIHGGPSLGWLPSTNPPATRRGRFGASTPRRRSRNGGLDPPGNIPFAVRVMPGPERIRHLPAAASTCRPHPSCSTPGGTSGMPSWAGM